MTGRAREALFSSLGDVVVGARVLDLFAGSGALGLEALSRGAASAVFVERARAAVASLRANLAAVALGGEVHVGEAEDYLAGPGLVFDLAFVDPPYSLSLPSVERVLERLESRLAPGAVVVLHRRHGEPGPVPPATLLPTDDRRYGDSRLLRYRKEAP